MKKSLLAVAVLGAFAGVASAQSSVTLSGAVDLGVRRTSGQWDMATAGSSRSNLTFSGVEDLGGGLKASFNLNHRFRPNDGVVNTQAPVSTAGSQFWRNAWVQLEGGFGGVRLGRFLGPLQEFNGDFEPWGTDTVGSVHTGGVNAGVRYNNQIGYRTPSLGGFQLVGAIAAGDNNNPTTGGSGTERPAGVGLRYRGGPVDVALAWDRNAVDQKTVGVYGAFNAGFATLMAQYEKGDVVAGTTPVNNLGVVVPAGVDSAKRYSLGAKVPVGAATLKAGYARYSDEDVKRFGIGVDYALSKRTTLYSDASKLSGDNPTLSDDEKKSRFDVGIWHKF